MSDEGLSANNRYNRPKAEELRPAGFDEQQLEVLGFILTFLSELH
jgi:hypothetical protein